MAQINTTFLIILLVSAITYTEAQCQVTWHSGTGFPQYYIFRIRNEIKSGLPFAVDSMLNLSDLSVVSMGRRIWQLKFSCNLIVRNGRFENKPLIAILVKCHTLISKK